MKIFEAHEFLKIAQDFTHLAESSATGATEIIEGVHGEATLFLLRDVRQRCLAMGLRVTAQALQETETQIGYGALTWGRFIPRAEETVNILRHELSTILLLGVDPDKEKYFKEIQPFGAVVASAFPQAATDIEEAAKCFALDRGTATVFHLMRVMEEGLKALAKLLGIPYAPSWESYISQISDKIETKHKKKGVKWKKDEPFFKEILGTLVAVKIAWRNPTMHIVRTYQPDEAEDVFRAVRTFMQKLADRIAPKEAGMFAALLKWATTDTIPVAPEVTGYQDPFLKDDEKTK
ncbi:hypothetical protein [Candidatus Binatus sp.]|uniref:hypothetical protein n=1 Tax=Candidatus Binatus sp. TaxID=2811406 RepID=UPI003F97E219